MYDSVSNQKNIWPKVVGGEWEGKPYSFAWGDPEAVEAVNTSGKVLGNYKRIKEELLMPNIKGKTILDVGCFDGKWTTYMSEAKRVICADLDRKGYDGIKERLKWSSLEFYLCPGDNFEGIADESVDFVFSMDSLVRSEVDLLSSYIREIRRILSPGGKVCIHLPAQDQHMSWELGFTQIGSQDILNICEASGLGNARVDKTTVNHGVLLLINF